MGGGLINRRTAARRSPYRLAKYAQRGFALLHPLSGGLLGDLDQRLASWGSSNPDPSCWQGLQLLLNMIKGEGACCHDLVKLQYGDMDCDTEVAIDLDAL